MWDIFRKESQRQKAKRLITKKVGLDAKILDDSKVGFYVKITSDVPPAYFHVADNGVVTEVTESKERKINRGPACRLLAALVREVLE